MIVLWAALAAGGLALAAYASARGVDHTTRAAAGLQVSPFVIGFTLLAIGTDLPEIANSIVASLADHGDINVGDSVGSALAQATLVIGLVPFLAGGMSVSRRNIGLLGGLSVAVLLLGVALMADGHLGRGDGIVLVLAWGAAVTVTWRNATPPAQPELPLLERRPLVHAALALAWLVLVAGGATAAVAGLTRVAEALAVPEYLVSFFGLALGTSLPELTVAVTAVRQGQRELALGDALGATLVDASLSVGIGPIIAPTAITAGLVVSGGLVAAAAVALSTGILVAAGRHNRLTAVPIVLLYVASVAILAAAAT